MHIEFERHLIEFFSKNSGQRRSAEGEKPHGKKGTKRWDRKAL